MTRTHASSARRASKLRARFAAISGAQTARRRRSGLPLGILSFAVFVGAAIGFEFTEDRTPSAAEQGWSPFIRPICYGCRMANVTVRSRHLSPTFARRGAWRRPPRGLYFRPEIRRAGWFRLIAVGGGKL